MCDLRNIKEADIQSVLHIDDVDEATFPLTELAGLPEGDLVKFCINPAIWLRATTDEREWMIVHWLAELANVYEPIRS